MGLFDFFKKREPGLDIIHQSESKHEELLGPTYLEGYTAIIAGVKAVKDFEWRRKLQLPSGQSKFQIRYFGRMYDEELLIGTENAPMLIFAVDPVTEQGILLFDGAKYGYNAMLCDTFDIKQAEGRSANNLYKDRTGNTEFEIILSAYYQMSKDEFRDFVDEAGNVQLMDGSTVTSEVAWRNSYDCFGITVINSVGSAIEIVSEELA